MQKMIIGTGKIWAAEMRVRVNPGRLDSQPAFFLKKALPSCPEYSIGE